MGVQPSLHLADSQPGTQCTHGCVHANGGSPPPLPPPPRMIATTVHCPGRAWGIGAFMRTASRALARRTRSSVAGRYSPLRALLRNATLARKYGPVATRSCGFLPGGREHGKKGGVGLVAGEVVVEECCEHRTDDRADDVDGEEPPEVLPAKEPVTEVRPERTGGVQ